MPWSIRSVRGVCVVSVLPVAILVWLGAACLRVLAVVWQSSWARALHLLSDSAHAFRLLPVARCEFVGSVLLVVMRLGRTRLARGVCGVWWLILPEAMWLRLARITCVLLPRNLRQGVLVNSVAFVGSVLRAARGCQWLQAVGLWRGR